LNAIRSSKFELETETNENTQLKVVNSPISPKYPFSMITNDRNLSYQRSKERCIRNRSKSKLRASKVHFSGSIFDKENISPGLINISVDHDNIQKVERKLN